MTPNLKVSVLTNGYDTSMLSFKRMIATTERLYSDVVWLEQVQTYYQDSKDYQLEWLGYSETFEQSGVNTND